MIISDPYANGDEGDEIREWKRKHQMWNSLVKTSKAATWDYAIKTGLLFPKMWSSLNLIYQCYGNFAETSSFSTKSPRETRNWSTLLEKLHKNGLPIQNPPNSANHALLLKIQVKNLLQLIFPHSRITCNKNRYVHKKLSWIRIQYTYNMYVYLYMCVCMHNASGSLTLTFPAKGMDSISTETESLESAIALPFLRIISLSLSL